MRSRAERTVLIAVAMVLVAAAVAAWWMQDRWLPQAGPWTEQAWRKITRPGPESLPPGKQPAQAGARNAAASEPVAPQPRKCVQGDGRVVYTDQPCPQGSREQPVEGAVTSLPSVQ